MQAQTRIDIFEEVFLVFLGLGTIVGIVVISYTLYNAYKYRDQDGRASDESEPTLGELPTGGEGGKKLFVSFGVSALIVIGLVIWSYGMLIDVESGPEQPEDAIEVDVEGNGFAWFFEYENGASSTNTMYVPAGTPVEISVTSGDVWHAFGISDMRVKADAIPGEYDQTWFVADEPGQYDIECFELCGPQHTQMTGTLEVVPQDEFDQWLEEEAPDEEENGGDENGGDGNESDGEGNESTNGDGNESANGGDGE